jgi:hypothetical protein
MYTLATLTQARQHLGISATDTSDDARILGTLQTSIVWLERSAGRRFVPRVAAVPHRLHVRADGRYNSTWLSLTDDLLALSGLTDGDDNTVPLTDVQLHPLAAPPYNGLRLINGRALLHNPDQPIIVSGIWGWHGDWDMAWRSTGDTVLNNPLTNTSTTITVNNAAGADGDGFTPRFSVGMLLRINGEYLRVVGINANTLTVLRAVQGTTAATHAQNSPISSYRAPADVLGLALLWLTWLYRQPDHPIPPPDLRAMTDLFSRMEVR